MTPRQWQLITSGVVVALAVVLQPVVFARLPLPGASPSIVLIAVVAVGMGCGPADGAVAGFAAGLALDLLPPAAGIVGVSALALLIAGHLAGRVRDPRGLAPAQLLGLVGGLAGLAGLVTVVLSALMGAPVASWPAVAVQLIAFIGYTAALALPVVPVLAALLRLAGGERRQFRRRARIPG